MRRSGKDPAEGQELELWQAYQAPGWGEDDGAQDGKLVGDLDPADQVRVWTTDRLRSLVNNLEPYINGTFGTVSTKHGQLYLAALRDMVRLWDAGYAKPAPVPELPSESEVEKQVQESARITRGRVLDQLEELRNRTRQDR